MTSPAYRLDPATGCYEWLGDLTPSGYGPYRYLYDRAHGKLPGGLYLDHMCRRRSCVRLEHLDVVTSSENLKRISSWYRRQLSRCPVGHPLSALGIRTPEDGIVCALCCNLPCEAINMLKSGFDEKSNHQKGDSKKPFHGTHGKTESKFPTTTDHAANPKTGGKVPKGDMGGC